MMLGAKPQHRTVMVDNNKDKFYSTVHLYSNTMWLW